MEQQCRCYEIGYNDGAILTAEENFIHFVCNPQLLVCSIAGSIAVADAVPLAGEGRNLSFIQGAGKYSSTLREGHRGIFDVHKLMLADRTPSLTVIRGGRHTN